MLDELDALDDEEVIERLVAVKGFGRWTAEMFLMFRLHRPDVLAGRRPGHRQRGATTVRAEKATRSEAIDEARGAVAAVSIGCVLVPVAESANGDLIRALAPDP